MTHQGLRAAILFCCVALAGGCHHQARSGDRTAQWYRGNTHTHTLWSDGDDFPEMVAEWYRANGYQFLALTDHNTLATDTAKWWRVPPNAMAREAHRKYRERYGPSVRERRSGDTLWVRLRRPVEYLPEIEQPGRFILVSGEEVTQYSDRKGAHLNVLNLRELIPPQEGSSLVEIFRRDLLRADDQERRLDLPISAVLNHPNFLWSQTAEDLIALPQLRFFEVYNGHPLVNVTGDSVHPGNERIWDIVLTKRARGHELLYGVATDDSHDYHDFAPNRRNPGRGWIMVRAGALHADSLMAAMRRGDFYASTGVTLAAAERIGNSLQIRIQPEPGVTYVTQFIGTRRGYDTTSVERRDSTGALVTRQYSRGVGAILSESRDSVATYTLRGDELYVRARVRSSRAKQNPSYAGELEMAWTQPVRP